MKLQTLIAALAIAAITLAPRRAHAGCDEDGSCGNGFAFAIAGVFIGGSIEASLAVAGVVTMIGGANNLGHHRASRGWRIANYVFAGLNLGAALAWGIVAADRIDTGLAISFAAPHLAVGAADLTVAVLSSVHSRDVVSLSLAPMAGRDVSGHSISGASLKMTF